MKRHMATETKMFFNYVLQENRPITDFIDGNYTFVNERLAKLYGMTAMGGEGFQRIDLSRRTGRASDPGERSYGYEQPHPHQPDQAGQVGVRSKFLERRLRRPRPVWASSTTSSIGFRPPRSGSYGGASEEPDVRGLPRRRWTRSASAWRTSIRWQLAHQGRQFDLDTTGTLPDGRASRDPWS